MQSSGMAVHIVNDFTLSKKFFLFIQMIRNKWKPDWNAEESII